MVEAITRGVSTMDLKDIKELIAVMRKNRIKEINLEQDDSKLQIVASEPTERTRILQAAGGAVDLSHRDQAFREEWCRYHELESCEFARARVDPGWRAQGGAVVHDHGLTFLDKAPPAMALSIPIDSVAPNVRINVRLPRTDGIRGPIERTRAI